MEVEEQAVPVQEPDIADLLKRWEDGHQNNGFDPQPILAE